MVLHAPLLPLELSPNKVEVDDFFAPELAELAIAPDEKSDEAADDEDGAEPKRPPPPAEEESNVREKEHGEKESVMNVHTKRLRALRYY